MADDYNTNLGTYQNLLQAVGFPAADAQARTSSVQRQLAQGLSDLNVAGDDERRQLDLGWEDRGLLNSGGRLSDLARSQGRQASKASNMEGAAADDIASTNYDMMRAIAQARAQEMQQANQQKIRDMNLAAEREQTARMLAQYGYGG